MPKHGVPFLLRFWDKIKRSDNCWLWTASVNTQGYGQMWQRRTGQPKRKHAVHRLSYQLAYGPIPEGLSVLHRCDTPRCVNPAHLFLGTQADNMTDMHKKARHCFGETHPLHRLTESDVRDIRKRYVRYSKHCNIYTLAEEFNVTFSLVAMIVRREIWQHI